MKNFNFIACIEIKELLGEKADNELTLLERIKEAPPDSIYYHTHSYFLRHFYLTGQFPNDFANWVGIELRDNVLSEKLGSVTPGPGKTIENIRTELINIIDDHLSDIKTIPFVVHGEPFYFIKSRIIEVETGTNASNLEEFIDALKDIHAGAIYYHIFEARMRARRRGKSDFSVWMDEVLGMSDLAERIENIDFYMYSLEDIRNKILNMCIAETGNGHGQNNP